MISIENEKIVVEYKWQKFECIDDFILDYYVAQQLYWGLSWATCEDKQ